MPTHPRRTARVARATLAALLVMALVAPAVSAHVALESSGPSDGEVVAGSPSNVVLVFTEDLVPDRSFFNLRSADGTIVGRGAPDPANPRALVLAPPELAPGAYRVEWQAIGTDGHVERGAFAFSVEPPPPTPTPPPTAPPSVAPSATPTAVPSATAPPATPTATPAPVDEAPAASTADVVIPIVAGLAILLALGALLLRRSRAG